MLLKVVTMLCNWYVFIVQYLRGLLILAPSTFEDMSIMGTSISTDIHWRTAKIVISSFTIEIEIQKLWEPKIFFLF
jgi:hypothetical protein